MKYVNILEDFDNRLCEQIDERLALGEDYETLAKSLQFNPNVMHTVVQALKEKDYLTPFQAALQETLQTRLEKTETMAAICRSVQIEVKVLRETHQLLRRRKTTAAPKPNEEPERTPESLVDVAKAKTTPLFNKRPSRGNQDITAGYREHFDAQIEALKQKDARKHASG